MKNKKYLRPAIIAVVLMIIVGITGYIAVQKGWNQDPTEPTDSSDTSDVTEPTGESGEKLNIIDGGYSFFPDDILPADADASQYTLPPAVCGVELPCVINNTPFVVTRIAKYSGVYLEDMSDEQVDNCLAIIVKNNTDDLIMTGTLVFKVNDTEEAVFKVNTLPAGKSCVVLEQNRRPFSAGDVLKYDPDNEQNYYYTRTAEEQQEISILDKIQVSGEDNNLSIRNRGSDTYDAVYVLYKNVQEGIYLGGVTYKLEFTDVYLGAEMTQKSNHYNSDTTEVVAVDKG